MQQQLKCAFCVLAAKSAVLARARLVQQGDDARQIPVPGIRNANTMLQGTAICDDHLQVTDAPGSTARAHGLIVPGR